MIPCTIQQILRAIHRPDVGQYGACTRCAHGDTTGKRCSHEYAGKPGDGASPSCAIVDEYHEYTTTQPASAGDLTA